MTRPRVVMAVLLALAALDLLFVVVTGSRSILPGLSPVGPAGFAARAAIRRFCWRLVLEGRSRPAWPSSCCCSCRRSSSSSSPGAG